MKTKLTSKIWIWIVQILLISGSAFLVFSKLSDGQLLGQFKQTFHILTPWHILILLLLSAIFWLLDTQVWRIALKPFLKIEMFRALKINLVAQSAGIITPFLAGDYGIRSYLLKKEIDSYQNTLVTMSYQLVKVGMRIIVGLAAISIVYFQSQWRYAAIALAIGLLLVGSLTVQQIVRVIAKSKLAQRFLRERKRLDFVKLKLNKSLPAAFLLFLCFSFQTALLIAWSGNESGFLTILAWVIITYSLTSFLPPMSFFDPLVKSAFGTLLYVQIANPEVLLFAFSATWLVNRGLPALISGFWFKRLSGLRQEMESSTT